MFGGKETILVNATVYHKYAGGGYDTKEYHRAYDVPAGISKDKEKLKKVGALKLLSSIGRDHEVTGEVIATDNEGFTKSVKFNYRPPHEKMLVPKGYTRTATKQGKKFDYVKAGNTLAKGAKKLGDAFDAFMGGGQKKTSTPKKRNTATTKKRTTTTAKRKTCNRKRTTNKKR